VCGVVLCGRHRRLLPSDACDDDDDDRRTPVPDYRITPRKVSSGRQFTGKNPPRPAAAQAGRILPVNYRLGETFLEGAIL